MKDFSSEFEFNTSRSGGKGGQNVNKVSSKVELRFHVMNSVFLTDEEKVLITEKLMARINIEGYLRVVSQVDRSQLVNKGICIEKFYALIEKALTIAKKRKASRPTRSSVENRLQDKKMVSEKKKNRKIT
ncbi:MAG: alternative ribosome rescue aminoacyl-tRNA hydrolase ArfB [Bacteroidota bacterium]|nr:alternative ribosome rescue aminoacyl-tRNA hydrolase ArfB [Bacteroidota bacterium]